MARLTNSRNLDPVINAAQEWIHDCLIFDNSLFIPGTLWTLENINEVRKAFVDHPDEGNDNFSTKLKGQMETASPSAKRLMAEVIWAILLFPSNIKAETKRQQVSAIWQAGGEAIEADHPRLSDDILSGIGSGGPGYNTNRWREVAFLISLAGDLKGKATDERKRILSDYQAFIDWIGEVSQDGHRQFRHMLRYFCFPELVERMSSNGERQAVLVGCGVMPRKAVVKLNDRQLDVELQNLRLRLEAEYPDLILDFYEPPLSGLWKSEEDREDKQPLATPPEIVEMKINGIVSAFEGDSEVGQLKINQATIERFCVSLLSKRFLISTGLAGSGKTKLAYAFARWISPSSVLQDVFLPGSVIPSSNVTYYVNKSDSLSVEFWNSANENGATKVTLPREMINEWAAYIKSHSLPQTTQARDIREAVKASSRYSDQLHSFETHLKAAAFALLKSRSQDSDGCYYSVVPVGADWIGNENILGYSDGLQQGNYVAKPALELILHADDHAEIPHFLILDEMNLSHVERYFADILSIIESDEGLNLYSGDMEKPDTWRQTAGAKRVPPRLKRLPENLFIIGTVNVDETTYMFSPKVLDRANVIEFRMNPGELEGFLANPAKPDLSKLDGKGASFGKAFVDAAKSPVTVPAEVKASYDAELMLLFKTLQAHGAEFGYRTAYETARFIHFYKLLGNHADGDTTWFSGAFDCVVFQKLLPKLHGSRTKLGPVLKKLWFLCVNDAAGRGDDALKAAEEAARSTDKKAEPSAVVLEGAPYPLSAEKIGRMWRLLIENGFASFAEA